jgi:hypothetical protein
MRLLLAISLALLLAACTSSPAPVHDKVFFSVELVDELPPNVYGTSRCSFETVCQIEILRSEYPYCLIHEIRHGFESMGTKAMRQLGIVRGREYDTR